MAKFGSAIIRCACRSRDCGLFADPGETSQILDTPAADLDLPASSSTGAKAKARKEGPKMTLNEIGPRFVLQPVKIFEGSFNGATLYENKGVCSGVARLRGRG